MESSRPESSPERRARGRPRRLSPEALLDAALALFEEEPATEFTLGRLARRLDVPITSLYTYFPNRDALLDAAANRVFARFAWTPPPGAAWSEVLLSWMRALERHFAQYPIAQQLLSWDQRISPAWLRVLAPIITLLYAEGLRGAALVRTFQWLNNGVIGLITAHAYTARHPARPTLSAVDLAGSSPEALAAQLEFWSHVGAVNLDETLDAGFRALMSGVAAALPPRGPWQNPAGENL